MIDDLDILTYYVSKLNFIKNYYKEQSTGLQEN